ncbi:hypothetical protein, partial [Eisenibacter elegans]|uniref:hypothetical protein n=1 Tax=Eisenibacter elegans TaxID=997 RepID=UPI00041BD8E2
MTITGTVRYQDLGMGFWGIIDHSGQQWRPLNLPSALQKEGLEVHITAKKAKDQMSSVMWGTAIEITDYQPVS